MSRDLNKVQLIGRVGGDPDCRQMPNGNAVANLTLATGESWKDKNTGQRMERTEWHRVVFFGRLAEIVQQYVRKGSLIYVEGRLQTREWEKDGVKRYTTEIVIDMGGQMQMLDSRNQGQSQGQNQGYQQAPQPQQHNQGQYNQAPPQHQTGSHSYAQATGGGNYHAPAPQRQQPPPQPQAAPNQPQRSSNGNAPGYNPYNANSGQPQQTRQHQPAPVAQVPPNYDGSLAEDEEIPF